MNKKEKEKDEHKGDSTQMQTDGPADVAQEPDNTPDGQDKMDDNDDEHLSKGEDTGRAPSGGSGEGGTSLLVPEAEGPKKAYKF